MNRPGSGDIPPDASVRAVDLAALDIEMTGLRAGRGDRVIEVAVARGRYGAAPEVWSTLINPGRPIRTSEIHGITAAMVAGAPGFAAIRPNLDRWLDGAVLVAHHAHMDLSFLQTEYRRCDHSFLDRPTIDTLGLARNLPGLDSRTLTSLCARFGIDHTDAHRAAGDARATWALSTRLLDTLDPGAAGDFEIDEFHRAWRAALALHEGLLLAAGGCGPSCAARSFRAALPLEAADPPPSSPPLHAPRGARERDDTIQHL